MTACWTFACSTSWTDLMGIVRLSNACRSSSRTHQKSAENVRNIRFDPAVPSERCKVFRRHGLVRQPYAYAGICYESHLCLTSPDFAAAALKPLPPLMEIPLVLTLRPDRPKGRAVCTDRPAVKQLRWNRFARGTAPENCVTPKPCNAQRGRGRRNGGCSRFDSSAAGVDTPKHGCLNIHAYSTPVGAARRRFNARLKRHDAETGVYYADGHRFDTMMWSANTATPSNRPATANEVHDALMEISAVVAVAADLQQLVPKAVRTRSNSPKKVGYVLRPKTKQRKRRVSSGAKSAAVIERKIRALSNPVPAAWVEYQNKPVTQKPAGGSDGATKARQAESVVLFGGRFGRLPAAKTRWRVTNCSRLRRMNIAAFAGRHIEAVDEVVISRRHYFDPQTGMPPETISWRKRIT